MQCPVVQLCLELCDLYLCPLAGARDLNATYLDLYSVGRGSWAGAGDLSDLDLGPLRRASWADACDLADLGLNPVGRVSRAGAGDLTDLGLNPVGRVSWAGARDLAYRVPCETARIAAAHKGAAAELVRTVQIAAAVVGAGLAVLT